MGALTWLLGLLRAPATLLLPFLSRARRSTLLLRIVLWTVHVLIVALILVGLHFLNQALGIDAAIPHRSRFLAENWLPILFLLVYVLAWLGWWLWKLLVTDDSYTEFPDITEAWEEAMQALQQYRIDLREVPLFLLVGRTEGSMEALFKGSKLPLEGRQAPAARRRPAARLRHARRGLRHLRGRVAARPARRGAGRRGRRGRGQRPDRRGRPAQQDEPARQGARRRAGDRRRHGPRRAGAATCRPRKSARSAC